MSAVEIYEVQVPDLSPPTTTEEFLVDSSCPMDATATRRAREWSPEEKLALLRDFIQRKYGL